MIEAIKALGTLVALLFLVWVAGVENWFLAGLWTFIALWGARVGIHLFRSTRRRRVLLACLLGALGAASAAAMQIFWTRQTVSLTTGIAAVALITTSLVLALVARRQSVG